MDKYYKTGRAYRGAARLPKYINSNTSSSFFKLLNIPHIEMDYAYRDIIETSDNVIPSSLNLSLPAYVFQTIVETGTEITTGQEVDLYNFTYGLPTSLSEQNTFLPFFEGDYLDVHFLSPLNYTTDDGEIAHIEEGYVALTDGESWFDQKLRILDIAGNSLTELSLPIFYQNLENAVEDEWIELDENGIYQIKQSAFRNLKIIDVQALTELTFGIHWNYADADETSIQVFDQYKNKSLVVEYEFAPFDKLISLTYLRDFHSILTNTSGDPYFVYLDSTPYTETVPSYSPLSTSHVVLFKDQFVNVGAKLNGEAVLSKYNQFTDLTLVSFIEMAGEELLDLEPDFVSTQGLSEANPIPVSYDVETLTLSFDNAYSSTLGTDGYYGGGVADELATWTAFFTPGTYIWDITFSFDSASEEAEGGPVYIKHGDTNIVGSSISGTHSNQYTASAEEIMDLIVYAETPVKGEITISFTRASDTASYYYASVDLEEDFKKIQKVTIGPYVPADLVVEAGNLSPASPLIYEISGTNLIVKSYTQYNNFTLTTKYTKEYSIVDESCILSTETYDQDGINRNYLALASLDSIESSGGITSFVSGSFSTEQNPHKSIAWYQYEKHIEENLFSKVIASLSYNNFIELYNLNGEVLNRYPLPNSNNYEFISVRRFGDYICLLKRDIISNESLEGNSLNQYTFDYYNIQTMELETSMSYSALYNLIENSELETWGIGSNTTTLTTYELATEPLQANAFYIEGTGGSFSYTWTTEDELNSPYFSVFLKVPGDNASSTFSINLISDNTTITRNLVSSGSALSLSQSIPGTKLEEAAPYLESSNWYRLSIDGETLENLTTIEISTTEQNTKIIVSSPQLHLERITLEYTDNFTELSSIISNIVSFAFDKELYPILFGKNAIRIEPLYNYFTRIESDLEELEYVWFREEPSNYEVTKEITEHAVDHWGRIMGNDRWPKESLKEYLRRLTSIATVHGNTSYQNAINGMSAEFAIDSYNTESKLVYQTSKPMQPVDSVYYSELIDNEDGTFTEKLTLPAQWNWNEISLLDGSINSFYLRQITTNIELVVDPSLDIGSWDIEGIENAYESSPEALQQTRLIIKTETATEEDGTIIITESGEQFKPLYYRVRYKPLISDSFAETEINKLTYAWSALSSHSGLFYFDNLTSRTDGEIISISYYTRDLDPNSEVSGQYLWYEDSFIVDKAKETIEETELEIIKLQDIVTNDGIPEEYKDIVDEATNEFMFKWGQFTWDKYYWADGAGIQTGIPTVFDADTKRKGICSDSQYIVESMCLENEETWELDTSFISTTSGTSGSSLKLVKPPKVADASTAELPSNSLYVESGSFYYQDSEYYLYPEIPNFELLNTPYDDDGSTLLAAPTFAGPMVIKTDPNSLLATGVNNNLNQVSGGCNTPFWGITNLAYFIPNYGQEYLPFIDFISNGNFNNTINFLQDWYLTDQLIENGDFSTVVTAAPGETSNNWSAAYSDIATTVFGKLRITVDSSGSSGRAYQSFSTEIGTSYIVNVDCFEETTQANIYINNNSNFTGAIAQDLSAGDGTKTVTFTATATTTYLILGISSTENEYADFDNVSVKKATDDVALSLVIEDPVSWNANWGDKAIEIEANQTLTEEIALQQDVAIYSGVYYVVSYWVKVTDSSSTSYEVKVDDTVVASSSPGELTNDTWTYFEAQVYGQPVLGAPHVLSASILALNASSSIFFTNISIKPVLHFGYLNDIVGSGLNIFYNTEAECIDVGTCRFTLDPAHPTYGPFIAIEGVSSDDCASIASEYSVQSEYLAYAWGSMTQMSYLAEGDKMKATYDYGNTSFGYLTSVLDFSDFSGYTGNDSTVEAIIDSYTVPETEYTYSIANQSSELPVVHSNLPDVALVAIYSSTNEVLCDTGIVLDENIDASNMILVIGEEDVLPVTTYIESDRPYYTDSDLSLLINGRAADAEGAGLNYANITLTLDVAGIVEEFTMITDRTGKFRKNIDISNYTGVDLILQTTVTVNEIVYSGDSLTVSYIEEII